MHDDPSDGHSDDNSDGLPADSPIRGLSFPLHPLARVEIAKHLLHCSRCRAAYEDMEREGQDSIQFREGFRSAEAIEREMASAARALHARIRRVQSTALTVGGAVAASGAALIAYAPSLPWWSGVVMVVATVVATRSVERLLLRRDARTHERQAEPSVEQPSPGAVN